MKCYFISYLLWLKITLLPNFSSRKGSSLYSFIDSRSLSCLFLSQYTSRKPPPPAPSRRRGTLRAAHQTAGRIQSMKKAVYSLSLILLIIGVLHGLNLLALPVMGRLLTLNRQLDESGL